MEPTYFALIVLAASLRACGLRMVGVFVIACLFGGSAALSLTALGGAPVNPAAFALPFLMFWSVRAAGARTVGAALVDPDAGLWLFLLVLWALMGAYFMPRLL